MKFEYSHEFEIDSMLKAQGELCQNLYSGKTRWLSIAALFLCAIITIFIPAVALSLAVDFFMGQKFGRIPTFIGLVSGIYLYAKWGVPFVNGYFFEKRQVELGDAYVSNYTFSESGILVVETGRNTQIEWTAISSLEQTPSYIGLLCKGLFYYLPRQVIGDIAAQNQFISQCSRWIETQKQTSLLFLKRG